jgi:hypothetical protein
MHFYDCLLTTLRKPVCLNISCHRFHCSKRAFSIPLIGQNRKQLSEFMGVFAAQVPCVVDFPYNSLFSIIKFFAVEMLFDKNECIEPVFAPMSVVI